MEIERDPKNPDQKILTVTERLNVNTLRKTLFLPYEATDTGLTLVDANVLVDSIRDVRVVTPPCNTSGFNIYLSSTYSWEYPNYRNCYRFVDLYAVQTSGNWNVQGFTFWIELAGSQVTLNPYVNHTPNHTYQYGDSMYVSNMQIGNQYSKIVRSISPYYVDTGTGQYGAVCDLWWSGTYNGQYFKSGCNLPVW